MPPSDTRTNHQDTLLKAVFDASPTMMFVVDDDVRILECNAAALQLFSKDQPPFQRRGGDALLCLQAVEHPDGCGHAALCRDCVVRNAVTQAIQQGARTIRKRAVLELVQDSDQTVDFYALITVVPFDHAGRRLVLLTIENISDLTELWRIVSICSCCKKVRADDHSWVSIEEYFRSHWDLRFTHGYCPSCMSAQLNWRQPGPDKASESDKIS